MFINLLKGGQRWFWIGVSLIIMVSCGGDDETVVEDRSALDEQTIVDYLTNNGITAVRDDSGIHYEILTENQTGSIQQISGSILTVYYNARILDGGEIEAISAADLDEPAKMKQGVGAIFPVGLDIGLGLMKEGEIFKFYIPSDLAYGSFSFSTVIPENSVIEVEVELLAIQNEADQLMEDSLLIQDYITLHALNDTITNPLDSVDFLLTGEYYKRLASGINNATILPGTTINIDYNATFLDESQFDATNGISLSYNFGTGVVIDGLDNGIGQMERGERALIIMPSANAYRESAMYIPTYLGAEFVQEQIIPTYAAIVPPFKVLVFDVTLQ